MIAAVYVARKRMIHVADVKMLCTVAKLVRGVTGRLEVISFFVQDQLPTGSSTTSSEISLQSSGNDCRAFTERRTLQISRSWRAIDSPLSRG